MEESRTGVDGGMESSSLVSGTGLSYTGAALFKLAGRLGGPIRGALLVATAVTVLVLPVAVNAEFAMAPRV
jgi:hypothetical protein